MRKMYEPLNHDFDVELVQKPNDITFGQIDQFVRQHPDGTIFQSSFYFNIFFGSKRNKPYFVICRNKNQAIEGLLLFVIQYQAIAPFAYCTSRSLIIGGPVIADQNKKDVIMNCLISYYDSFISGKAIYTQIRNQFDTEQNRNEFVSFDYNYEEHLNILLDLSKTEDQLWKEMHTKRRNEVKRAEREGLYVKMIENQEDLFRSYHVLRKLYWKIGLPLYERNIFVKIYEDAKKNEYFRFFGVYLNKKLIGTMYTFSFKGRIYNWFAGSYKTYYKKYPNDLLPWKIFLWGKENGYTSFDWGGAGKPGVDYGVRDYKAKFGGEFVNYGRYEKIHNKPIFSIVSIGFKMLRYIRKKIHF